MTTFLDIYQPIVRLYNHQSFLLQPHVDVEFPNATTHQHALDEVKSLFKNHLNINETFLQELTIVNHQVVMGLKPVLLDQSVQALLMTNFIDMIEAFHIPANLTIQRLIVSPEVQQQLMLYHTLKLYISIGHVIDSKLGQPRTHSEYTTLLETYPQLQPFRQVSFHDVHTHLLNIEGCYAFHPKKKRPCKISALSCFKHHESIKKCKNFTLSVPLVGNCRVSCPQFCHPQTIYMEGEYILMCIPANFWVALQNLTRHPLPLDLTTSHSHKIHQRGKPWIMIVFVMVITVILVIFLNGP